MAYSRCEKCGELRFDDKINLCANCGYRILRTSKSYEWNFTINQFYVHTRAYSRIKVKQ
jgi:ribosomal protein L37E